MTDQEPLTGQVIEIETEREAESGTEDGCAEFETVCL